MECSERQVSLICTAPDILCPVVLDSCDRERNCLHGGDCRWNVPHVGDGTRKSGWFPCNLRSHADRPQSFVDEILHVNSFNETVSSINCQRLHDLMLHHSEYCGLQFLKSMHWKAIECEIPTTRRGGAGHDDVVTMSMTACKTAIALLLNASPSIHMHLRWTPHITIISA